MASTLCIDVGNTAVKAGLHVGAGWTRVVRFDSAAEAPWAERLRDALGEAGVTAAGIASVVPGVSGRIAEAVEAVWGVTPGVVDGTMTVPAACAPFHIDYATPATLGADRVAAAAAAFLLHARPVGRAVVALDAGTAVTLDAVTADGAFVGGAILPGPGLLARTLARDTAQLPEVPFDPPGHPIGRSTADALRAGLAYLTLDGLAGLLARTARALAPDGPAPLVVATGGWAATLADHLPFDAVAPHLVLDGVRLLTAGGA